MDASESHGVFFHGTQAQELTALRVLMRHMTHKGSSGAMMGFTGAAMGGGMFFHPWTLAKVFAGTRALQFLFEHKAGRSFLLASRNLPPGSPLLQQRLNQVLRAMPSAPPQR